MNAQANIHLTVNGIKYSLPEKPGEMLSDLLRYRLHLTGTKIACGEAECGACTVILNGEPVLSCSFPAAKANGATILTIEGLADVHSAPPSDDSQIHLHPLQEAFIKHGAVQCGFCIPGQIMTSYALLQRNPTPDDDDIKYALKDTLCRCAGYPSIINAIHAAAESLRAGKPITLPDIPLSTRAQISVGTLHPRQDAVAKVTGKAIYTDDIRFENMLHARVKRAGVPSAFLKTLDVSRARNLPGVVAVLTAEDIPGEHNHGLIIPDWPSLVGIGERIRTVGDAVAIVAAETREIASQALELIETEFDLLPVIDNPVKASCPDCDSIHPAGNLLKHIKVRKGEIEKGFSEADIILEHTYHTPMHDHAFMEPECSIARPTPEGRMEIYVGSQIPYSDRNQVARALRVPEERVHIIGQLIGGGFGGKEDIAGQIHAALLANVTGRPVKLLWDRQESLLTHPKRHATQIRVKVGAKKDGHLTSVETELYGDTGAYASLGEKVMTRATTHSSGPYEIPHVKADCYAMYTNNPPAGAFRGFGVMQSAFAVETMMDTLAEKLQIDPVELRRINALRVGSVTNTGQTLRESVGLMECIDRVDQEMRRHGGENSFAPRPVENAPHLIRAWGFAVGFKNTGLGGGSPDKAGAEVELRRDGTFQVRSSSAELGQGLPTVLQLIAAEELGQSPQRVDVLLMDTDLTPDGGPTTASRQTFVTGNAVRHAAKALRQLLTSEVAEKFDIPPQEIRFIEGLVQVNGNKVTLSQLAEELISSGRQPMASYTYWAPATRPLGQGGDMHFAYSFAAQAAEVEVNTLTGEVQVVRLIIANDVGAAINPLGLRGQIEGGAIMGIGHALTENFIVEEGRVITDRLARYRMPSITFTPEITPIVVEHPVAEGPFGAKGVGEIVLIPTIPAITNAVYNAVGVRIDRIPVDQEKILLALKEKAAPQE
ncbi:MAG: molybdopterin cofactor-binding domain-containing protein [Chloroflexota bacterium]|jgi:xanthine dehydrogenase molybdenum-binding subunit